MRRQVHGAHAAPAEQRLDRVAAERLADARHEAALRHRRSASGIPARVRSRRGARPRTARACAAAPTRASRAPPRVQRLGSPDRLRQLTVGAERGSAGGRVPLGHVPDEPVGLRPDRELVPRPVLHQHQPAADRVVVEAGCLVLGRRRARCLGVGACGVERELEEASAAGVGDAREDTHDIAVVKRRPSRHPQEVAVAAEECPVDAAAVDEEPLGASPLQREVAGARDELLRVGLEGDVVRALEPPDRDAGTRQEDAARRRGRSGDDELCWGRPSHPSFPPLKAKPRTGQVPRFFHPASMDRRRPSRHAGLAIERTE